MDFTLCRPFHRRTWPKVHELTRISYFKSYFSKRDGSCCLSKQARPSRASLSAALLLLTRHLLPFLQGKGEQTTFWLKGKDGFPVPLPEFTEEEAKVSEIL